MTVNSEEGNPDKDLYAVPTVTPSEAGRMPTQGYQGTPSHVQHNNNYDDGIITVIRHKSSIMNYKYNFRRLSIIVGIIFGIFGLITILLWTAGFIPERSFKENEQVTTCFVTSVSDVSKLCSNQYCKTINPKTHTCTSYGTTYYTCYDVIGYVQFTDTNGTLHTFTVSYHETVKV